MRNLAYVFVLAIMIWNTSQATSWNIQHFTMSQKSSVVDYEKWLGEVFYVHDDKLLFATSNGIVARNFKNDKAMGWIEGAQVLSVVDNYLFILSIIDRHWKYGLIPIDVFDSDRKISIEEALIPLKMEFAAQQIFLKPLLRLDNVMLFKGTDRETEKIYFCKANVDVSSKSVKCSRTIVLEKNTPFLPTLLGDILTQYKLYRMGTGSQVLNFKNKIDLNYFRFTKFAFQDNKSISIFNAEYMGKLNFSDLTWNDIFIKDQDGNRISNIQYWGVNEAFDAGIVSSLSNGYQVFAVNLKNQKLLTFKDKILEGLLPDGTLVLKERDEQAVIYVDLNTSQQKRLPLSNSIGYTHMYNTANCTDGSQFRVEYSKQDVLDIRIVTPSGRIPTRCSPSSPIFK